MKRHHVAITLIAALACFVAVIIRPDLIATVFAFVFLGYVPGTDFTIPSWVSLAIMTILVVLGFRWIFDEPVYRTLATPKDLSRRASARRKVLRRTRVVAKKTALAPAAVEVRAKV